MTRIARAAEAALLILLLLAQAAPCLDETAAAKQFKFAKGLFDRGMLAECVEETTKFLEFYGDAAILDKALYLHAEANYRLGKRKEAAEAFGRFLDRFPASPLAREARYALAWCRLDLKDDAEALRLFRTLFDAPDREMRADARLRAALILARTGRAAEAEPLLEAVGRESPAPAVAPEAALALARVEASLGKPAEAARTLKALLKRHADFPDRAAAHFLLGEIRYKERKTKEALAAYEEGLALAGTPRDRARFRHAIAWCRFDLGDFAAAAEGFAEVLKSDADPALTEEARLTLGKSLFHARRYAEAVAALAQVKGPLADEARFYEGFSHYKAKEPAKALEAFAAVPEKAGEVGRLALFYRGVVLFDEKRHAEAAALFERYLAAGGGGKAEEARFNIAQCRLLAGDREAALDAFRRLAAEAGDPETREKARFSLAELLAADGKADEAAAALDAVPADSRRRAEALLRAGDILRAAGRTADALARYRAGAGDSPAGRTAALRAGKLLAAAGDRAAAEAMFLKADRKGEASQREALYELARLARDRGDLDALRTRTEPLLDGGVAFRLEAMNLLAEGMLAAGLTDSAEVLLRRAAAEGKAGPAAVEARLLLAGAREKAGQADEAIALLEETLTLARSNEELGRAQYLLGKAREAKGEADRAARDYLKVDILYRDASCHPAAMLRLAGIHLAKGRKADAVKTLEPILPRLQGDDLAAARALLERAK